MQVELNLDEMTLAVLALQRMRMEIDVDGSNKISTMNGGQAQACRFTILFADNLINKLTKLAKEERGTRTDT